MTSPTIPMQLSAAAQIAVVRFAVASKDYGHNSLNLRGHFERIDKAYAREENLLSEHRKSRAANKYGDASKFQDITVPVVLPAVESAVTYQASVFLTGEPLFGVVSSPQFVDEAIQMQAKIADDAVMGGWVAELMKVFRDGFKYNLAYTEVTWESKKVPVFETDVAFSATEAKPKEILWQGNTVRRLDPYNTFIDPRVAPTKVSEDGEFAGYVEIMSRIKFKDFLAKLQTKIIGNVTKALESGISSNDFYVPAINSEMYHAAEKSGANSGDFNWLAWADLATDRQGIQYQNSYNVMTLYARILPADFGIKVSAANTPQVWKFIIVNDSIVVYAERQTNGHNLIPILVTQPNEDGLGYQTKSLATNVQPVQYLSSAMWNSVLAARRRSVGDRTVYDPSRISEAHMNNPNPSAKIPVRPSAYGKPVAESVYAFPFRDDQSGIMMQESQQLIGMANMITGQNPARQGQFVKGNKTRQEFDTVMGNANGRDQTTSMLLEAQLFTPLKHILKLNILQFQPAEELYDRVNKKDVSIDPVALRKAVLEFKISDGLVPSDKIMNADSWGMALQTIATSPQITGEYNIAPMFSYLMKLRGADLSPFEKSPEQKSYEQALGAWQGAVAKALESGVTPDQLPPQPTPEQYGYKPGEASGGAQAPAPQVRSNINNITNNITNVE